MSSGLSGHSRTLRHSSPTSFSSGRSGIISRPATLKIRHTNSPFRWHTGHAVHRLSPYLRTRIVARAAALGEPQLTVHSKRMLKCEPLIACPVPTHPKVWVVHRAVARVPPPATLPILPAGHQPPTPLVSLPGHRVPAHLFPIGRRVPTPLSPPEPQVPTPLSQQGHRAPTPLS